MTVKELIEALEKIEDKDLDVCVFEADVMVWLNVDNVNVITSDKGEPMWVGIE